jgi:predicted RNase H-like nuclease
MGMIQGVDGCAEGWLSISLEVGGVRPVAKVFPSDARALLSESWVVTAIDIPIGLPSAGARRCDTEARSLLGPLKSSVFPAPVRAALSTDSYESACLASKRASGKGLSRQTYGILPKIRSVDVLLRQSPALLNSVREVHPEISFYFWNGKKPLRHPKKSGFGFMERLALVEKVFGNAAREVREAVARKQATDDDILDAFAALWTAQRIHDGTAERVSARGDRDDFGLPMQIWG